MAKEKNPAPANYKGVMVSSTFTDLKEHRAALMKALQREELFGIGIETYVPNPDDDVISSSLNMVRKGSAYIGLISHRYGQVPKSAERNPHAYSVTRLEFEEAQNLDLPTLVFIMGADHPVKAGDVETASGKRKKLEAYRKRAKEGRIYVVFESLEDFTQQAIHAVASLRRYLDKQAQSATPQSEEPPTPEPSIPDPDKPVPIPSPPAFYAEPAYIGSHQFVGRKAQLEILNDWAAPADSHPILLFEAIGGAGKSMLTWEWVNSNATSVRDDWAGRFWYSFYERGAIMADFCRRALAYITGQPLENFRKKKTPELGELLLQHLKDKPWLIVFDGLERVLVAYHRFDAAQLADEEAGKSDEIADRDPCAAIRPEDDELLRALAGAGPSKLLLTSRLIPRVLLNAASQPIPGVLRERLPGLRPTDAEAFFRASGVTGDSEEIQNYLQGHCDCHPLVTGVLAGLVNGYLPDRGNFDAWATDLDSGGRLNLADLDLVQKRNHILEAALNALDEKSRQLLSTLALLSEAADYPTLSALSPHLPPDPEEVEKPEKPGKGWFWEIMSEDDKEHARKEYSAALKEYEQALKDRPEFLAALRKLQETVTDLEHRGLLQYDPQTRRHDLHPVVRGIAAGRLRQEEKERYGQRVVDHFSRKAHSSYEDTETLEDLRDGLHVVRTLLQMGRYQEAYNAYRYDLAVALVFNLEAHAETLYLLRPFFPQGWGTLPSGLNVPDGANMANFAAHALRYTGESKRAFAAYGVSLRSFLQQEHWRGMETLLSNISLVLADGNRLAKQERCLLFALDLAAQRDDKEVLFRALLSRFQQLADIGPWTDAEAMWQLLDPMGRNWQRSQYRPGEADYAYALFRFNKGDMMNEHLDRAEQLAKAAKNRIIVRYLHSLRGEWQLQQGRYKLAAKSLHEAVRMAREVGQIDLEAETLLALAKFHINQLPDPRQEGDRLAKARKPAHRPMAELWFAIGDREQAKKHALAAYKWAWADGEPYVHRYELNKAKELLEKLTVEIPKLPDYDPAKDEKLPWEDEVAAAIDKMRAEKETEESDEESEEE